MLTLRPYQERAVADCLEFFASKYRAAVCVLPTAAGKSILVAEVVKRLGEPVIIFQPTKEILQQNLGKLRMYGLSPRIFSASMNSKKVGDITLATIGSAIKRPELFQRFRYVIIDESHLVNSRLPKGKNKGKIPQYRKFIEYLEDVKILGLTATPFRMQTNREGVIFRFLTRSSPRIFQTVCHVTQISELIANGWWAKLQYFVVGNFDRQRLKLNTTGGDYDEKSLKTYYGDIRFKEGLLKVVRRLIEIGRRGVIVFTRFTEEAEYIDKHIEDAVVVTAKTPAKERDEIIRQFRSGEIPVVCNVAILTLGFDYPELDTVVLARPTVSLGLYYQMVGRGVRPHPDKEYSMIVDMCGNLRTFGKIEELRIDSPKSLPSVWNDKEKLTDVYL